MDKSAKLVEISMETVYLAGTAEMLDALLDKYDTTPPKCRRTGGRQQNAARSDQPDPGSLR